MREVLCPSCGNPGAYEGHDGWEWRCIFCPDCEWKYQMETMIGNIADECNYDHERMRATIIKEEDPELLAHFEKLRNYL
jgi:uncharacterized Zn finger protein (UPF0148 family)